MLGRAERASLAQIWAPSLTTRGSALQMASNRRLGSALSGRPGNSQPATHAQWSGASHTRSITEQRRVRSQRHLDQRRRARHDSGDIDRGIASILAAVKQLVEADPASREKG
jgi:hypothetical protein